MKIKSGMLVTLGTIGLLMTSSAFASGGIAGTNGVSAGTQGVSVSGTNGAGVAGTNGAGVAGTNGAGVVGTNGAGSIGDLIRALIKGAGSMGKK